MERQKQQGSPTGRAVTLLRQNSREALQVCHAVMTTSYPTERATGAKLHVVVWKHACSIHGFGVGFGAYVPLPVTPSKPFSLTMKQIEGGLGTQWLRGRAHCVTARLLLMQGLRPKVQPIAGRVRSLPYSPALAQQHPGDSHGHDLIAHYAALQLPVSRIRAGGTW
jgi:hypothetical protein